MPFSNGLLKSNKGPFADKIFYPDPQEDALNRVGFRLITWQGAEEPGEWEQGGWWHFDSILWDESGVHVYTEVTTQGAELHASFPWPELGEDEDERRREDLHDPEKAWRWVSAVLMEPLGLAVLSAVEAQLDNPVFQKEVANWGPAELQSE